jgi:carboxymethylenebutenolidase
VLVIHEIFGLTDWVRSVADQLAADGFIALAPDLLSGMGPNGGGTEALGDKVRETIRTLTPDQVADRLNAVREHGLKLPSANGKSASIGFCWGGTASFNYAVRQPALNAAVVYYGSGPSKDGEPDVEAMKKIAAPVLGCYGGDDARVTSTVEPTANAMAAAKKPFTHHAYDKAGHGFLRQSSADQREGANLKAAQEAWKTTLEFLREHTK